MTVTILGAGPGGYETALALASKGIEVNIVSKGPVGGTCLNEGCIPTKCLCKSAEVLDEVRSASRFGISTGEVSFDWKAVQTRKADVVSQLRSGVEGLLGNPLIHLYYGWGELCAPDENDACFHNSVRVVSDDGQSIKLDSNVVIVATGSRSASLPVPGADLPGVMDSTQLLDIEQLPKSICIIGAGVIGLEFACVLNSFGVKVTVVEYMKTVLPRFDTDIARRLKQYLSAKGIEFILGAQVQAISQIDNGLEVKYLFKDSEASVCAEKILMAVGRRPNIEQIGLAAAGVEYTRKGITVDEHFRTNVDGIYAIGDVTGGIMLAHAATFHGRIAIADILSRAGSDLRSMMSPSLSQSKMDAIIAQAGDYLSDNQIDMNIIPAAVFTVPEVATVGLSEEECKANGIAYKTAKAFYRANGKALAMAAPEGICKVLYAAGGSAATKQNDDAEGSVNAPDIQAVTTEIAQGTILGAHILGAHASDLIHEISALMTKHATIDELRRVIHAHPTLSELLLNVK